MANPQPTDAHLRIAHQISEQLMVSHFTAKQRRILDLILRLSWGCGKKEAIIPRQGDFEVVGIFKSDIKGELDLLERDGIISRDGDTYQFNKDYDKWRVSRARGYSQAKVSELLTINLSTHRQELVNHQPESKQITNKSVSELPTEPDTKLATPKETIKESIKETIYILIFNHWNQQGIIIHKELTNDMRSVIARTLRNYSAEEIKVTISNYAEIVTGEQYFFKYKWTLKDFLKRGIEKFADLEVAKSNFAKEKGGKARNPRDLPKTYTKSTNDDV